MAPEAGSPGMIVALDFADPAEALALLDHLDPALCRVKIGNELFTRAGPALVERIRARDFDVFLDLKLHDIPNTVAAACRAAADIGVWMINVHALGGRRMLDAAREAVGTAGDRPLVTAVTVLTSLDGDDVAAIGFDIEPAALVARLAGQAAEAGCDGVVCSGHEAAFLRAAHGEGFLLVTPGIRPVGAGADDQRRSVTPRDALGAGANHLVIGRPVTRASDPAAALRALAAEMRDAGSNRR